MKLLSSIAGIGLLIIGLTCSLFYFHVGRHADISNNSSDWALFGDYFGGVAGVLLAFLSVILIVYTIWQQSHQIELNYDESLKRDMLLNVSKSDEEVQRWLQRKIASTQSDRDIELGDIVFGLVNSSYAQQKELSNGLKRLIQLTSFYCESIALYRDNVDSHFIFQQHRRKAEVLIDFLEENQSKIPGTPGIPIKFCRMHLEGKNSA